MRATAGLAVHSKLWPDEVIQKLFPEAAFTGTTETALA